MWKLLGSPFFSSTWKELARRWNAFWPPSVANWVLVILVLGPRNFTSTSPRLRMVSAVAPVITGSAAAAGKAMPRHRRAAGMDRLMGRTPVRVRAWHPTPSAGAAAHAKVPEPRPQAHSSLF